jgi:hypothetical protein
MVYIYVYKLFFGGKFMKSIEKSKIFANPVTVVFMAAALSIAALAFASCGDAESSDLAYEKKGPGGTLGGGG